MAKRKPKTDAQAQADAEREKKRTQKRQQRAIREAKKDPEYMDHAFSLAGDLVIWKRPVVDPRVAALMSRRLPPAAIVFGKPCRQCANEARYKTGGACIVCSRARKRADRDFVSRQLPLLQASGT